LPRTPSPILETPVAGDAGTELVEADVGVVIRPWTADRIGGGVDELDGMDTVTLLQAPEP
jgi:hypothetical protein